MFCFEFKAYSKIDTMLNKRKAKGASIDIASMKIKFISPERPQSSKLASEGFAKSPQQQKSLFSEKQVFLEHIASPLLATTQSDPSKLSNLNEVLSQSHIFMNPNELFSNFVDIDNLDDFLILIAKHKDAMQNEVEAIQEHWRLKLIKRSKMLDLYKMVDSAAKEKRKDQRIRDRAAYGYNNDQMEVVEEGFNPATFYEQKPESPNKPVNTLPPFDFTIPPPNECHELDYSVSFPAFYRYIEP